MISSFILYIIIASSTIASPGPGVVMTLTNSLKYGFKYSIPGILGVVIGMFIISIIVGAGLGVLLVSNNNIYSVIKVMGSMYLLYLAWRLLANRNIKININKYKQNKYKKTYLFMQGFGITVINPKPIIFFVALFPQFITTQESYIYQFLYFSATFCLLIIIIHSLYGLLAEFIKKKHSMNNYFYFINVFGSSAYTVFAVMLLLDTF